jgi:membrane protein YqaA with SNARE-associated domain
MQESQNPAVVESTLVQCPGHPGGAESSVFSGEHASFNRRYQAIYLVTIGLRVCAHTRCAYSGFCASSILSLSEACVLGASLRYFRR